MQKNLEGTTAPSIPHTITALPPALDTCMMHDHVIFEICVMSATVILTMHNRVKSFLKEH